ncbi:MAG: SDR family oxidoreductase [Pedobacter sp.]|nr:SDR family oxidoreductase [Pedobacter sp.]
MSKKLADKIILITGGSGLLGKSIIKKLLSEDARVINADINLDETPDLSSLLCDITSEVSVKQAVEQVIATYGRIDGLINNAYPRTDDWGAKFEDIKLGSWKKNVDFQLNSYFFMSQEVLKRMKVQQSGSIVSIASIYGVVGPDFSVYDDTSMTMPAAYAAIKGGLINLSRYLASYYGPDGIRVNCISPGGVFNHQPDSFVEKYEAKVPLRRMAVPADISPAVLFLLSDDAAYITGQNLVIDGGWTSI